MPAPIPVPEGTIARKPLHFFWLADHSGSMFGRKIATLNQAIREAIPEIRQAVSTYPEVQVFMRAIRFSDESVWHVGPDPVTIEQFTWPELESAGTTATAKAIRMLSTELSFERMPRRGYPPVCILVSDGFCTDPAAEFDQAIANLLQSPWGRKAVRLAIAIGNEMDYDEKELMKFVSHPDIGVLKADTPQKLVSYIKWASVSASVSVSQGKSRGGITGQEPNVMLGRPPDEPIITSSTDAF